MAINKNIQIYFDIRLKYARLKYARRSKYLYD